jgi:hypothetical protein
VRVAVCGYGVQKGGVLANRDLVLAELVGEFTRPKPPARSAAFPGLPTCTMIMLTELPKAESATRGSKACMPNRA